MYGNLPQLQGAGKAWKKSWNIIEYISPRLWDVGKSLKIFRLVVLNKKVQEPLSIVFLPFVQKLGCLK